MVFREFGAKQPVFHQGEHTVAEILVQRHAALQGPAGQNTRAQDHVVGAVRDHGAHGAQELGRVLVVRVEHDHDVGLLLQGQPVAGFLVAAVTQVGLVPVRFDAELPGLVRGVVPAVIVHQDDLVHGVAGDFGNGLVQGFGRVVGGQDHGNAQAVQHAGTAPGLYPFTECHSWLRE